MTNEKKKNFRITEIYAFLATDEDNTEGVVSFQMDTGIHMPLIAADKDRLDSLKKVASLIKRTSGQNIKIVRFTTREDIGDVE